MYAISLSEPLPRVIITVEKGPLSIITFLLITSKDYRGGAKPPSVGACSYPLKSKPLKHEELGGKWLAL